MAEDLNEEYDIVVVGTGESSPSVLPHPPGTELELTRLSGLTECILSG
jgi:NADPH-dependent glutamate synthase beta subunit-like oxidoreductase